MKLNYKVLLITLLFTLVLIISCNKNVNETSNCDSIKDKFKKDLCYSNLAKTVKNSSFCEGISQERRDNCYMAFVLDYKDYSLCTKLTNEQLRTSCESLKQQNELNKHTEKDCGSDIDCFAESLKTCSLAKYHTFEDNQSAQAQIIASDEMACKVEWKSNDNGMICDIPISDLDKVTRNDLWAGHTLVEICKGSLADKLALQIIIIN